MTINRLYLAGPMRGYDEFNFPAFDAAAEKLRDRGFEVFNPADRDREVVERDGRTVDELTISECMAADTAWICDHADGVAVLPGWEASTGARAEVALAHALGLPVLRADAWQYGLADWEVELLDIRTPDTAQNPDDARRDNNGAPWHPGETSTGEVRTVASTGGAKGVKRARFDLLPAEPLYTVAEHFGRGAEKYEARNWERGYEWSKSFGALQRHAWQFWGGEDTDPETGSPHLAAVVFHALAMLEWSATHPEFDDRPAAVERNAALWREMNIRMLGQAV